MERSAKVLDSLAIVPLSPEKHHVRASGSTKSELIESETFAACGDDTIAGSRREAKGGDGELGNFG